MHTDPEVIALLAVGETDAATAEELSHLESCAQCRSDLASFREVGALLARTDPSGSPLQTPVPAVWDRVRAELELGPQAGTARSPVSPVPAPVIRAAAAAGPAGRRAAPRRRRRFLDLALAAVLALVVGVGGTLLVQRWTTPQETVLSATTLAALPDWSGSTGAAELEVDTEGRRWLVVQVEAVRPVDGFQQVWLINRDVTAMLQVGLLSYSGQRFLLPAEVDVARYPVVDVSDEPATDDGAHSGNSIVRGILPV